MMEGIEVMVDPGTGGGIEMRIGCHSGSVVSGVVGLKMPRLAKYAILIKTSSRQVVNFFSGTVFSG